MKLRVMPELPKITILLKLNNYQKFFDELIHSDIQQKNNKNELNEKFADQFFIILKN